MSTYFSGFVVTPTKVHYYLECPRKYWYYYINGETKYQQAEKGYFTLGEHVHDALREFFAIPPTLRVPEKLFELLDNRWATKNGLAGGFTTPENEEEAKRRAVVMLQRFLEKEDWRMEILQLPVEEGRIQGYRYAAVSNELAIGGVVDRIDRDPDGRLHVIDYKTGKNDEPDNWQLPMYAVLIGRLFGESVGRTSYLFLEHGRRHTEEISIRANVDTIKRVIDVVSRIPRSKNKEDFVCPQGDHCRHCDYLYEIGFDPVTGQKVNSNLD